MRRSKVTIMTAFACCVNGQVDGQVLRGTVLHGANVPSWHVNHES
jgi:hypothetical protein